MTIKDIARLSGCAVSTVSRALNDHPDVSEETKARIKQIVAENKFVPNANAKHLKQQVSNNIIVVVKGTFNLFFAVIIERIQADVGRAGYGVVLHYYDEDINEVRMAERLCRESKPKGLIFLGGEPENFTRYFGGIQVPAVLVTTSVSQLPYRNLSSVSVDDRQGGRMAVEHLIRQGHRRIGIIGGCSGSSSTSRQRLEGGMESLREHGISPRPEYCREGRFSLEDGYRLTGELLDQYPEITGIFAMSDLMAFGAVRAIVQRGLRVPEDVSVIGYDGIEMADYYQPPLTTLRQPAERLASLGVSLLLGSIEKKEPARHLSLTVELEPGGSVAPPPGKGVHLVSRGPDDPETQP